MSAEEEGVAPHLGVKQPEDLDEAQALALQAMRQEFEGAEGHGMPIDDALLLRYLRARKYHVEKAKKMLHDTLVWRKEYCVTKVVSEEMRDIMKEENATGKLYIRGFDRHGSPILYMRPGLENTVDEENNIAHLVYNLERCRAILQKRTKGYGKVTIVINYDGYTLKKSPSIKTSRLTIHILQNHYPETLGRAFLLNPPWLFRSGYKLISPFIDDVTKAKFCWLSGCPTDEVNQHKLQQQFDLEELEHHCGGKMVEPLFSSELYISQKKHLAYGELE